MPSLSLRLWRTAGRRALDEIEAAHRAIGRGGAGRRFAAQQINQAYVVLLSSQFQRFCRDLHDECTEHLVRQPGLRQFETILHLRFVEGRRLDVGNPNPGNLGADFGRLGVRLWEELRRQSPRNEGRQQSLLTLNYWRNAIAHQDFSDPRLAGRDRVRLSEIRQWRRSCDRLAVDMEGVMSAYLHRITKSVPW